MTDTVISVENLGKSYLIRHQVGGPSYRRLSEEIVNAVRRPFRALGRRRPQNGGSPEAAAPPTKERFWALKDVSFEVRRGEVLGIIGRNGAGKSTLLKILSRITEPSEGRVRIRGRVASLLEVGTGFHPELTGRENIFLNGTILGMTRREIQKKFDEIIAFAEIEKFLDTPVKRYSSGMYVRLAFAVAAHLEPEILVVDEVLAVGDAQFQKKCLGKMGDAVKTGRTVIFVSHNMHAVEALCMRCLGLSEGQIRIAGTTSAAVQWYLRPLDDPDRPESGIWSEGREMRLVDFRVLDSEGRPLETVQPQQAVRMCFTFQCQRPIPRPSVWLGISHGGATLFGASMSMDGHEPEMVEGRWQCEAVFPKLPLLPQHSFVVTIGVEDGANKATLIPPTEVADLRCVGMAADVGLRGSMAEQWLSGSGPLAIPYSWRFEDGVERRVYFE